MSVNETVLEFSSSFVKGKTEIRDSAQSCSEPLTPRLSFVSRTLTTSCHLHLPADVRASEERSLVNQPAGAAGNCSHPEDNGEL